MQAIAIAMRESTGTVVTAEQLRVTFIPVGLGVLVIFIALPAVVSARIAGVLGDALEAAARAGMLLVYLGALSRSADARRLFSYHGAEHMTIAACERHGRLPTAQEVGAESTVHVRCGSDFIALFLIVAGVVYAVLPPMVWWSGGVVRIGLVPVVATLAYEVMRVCARWPDEAWSRLLTWPGRSLQRVTTRRPTPDQLEVALAALQAAWHG